MRFKHIFTLLVLVLIAIQCSAAAPVISSFQSSGSLTWTNAQPDYKYTIEWASSPTGNWVSSWGPLCILPGTNPSMTVSVPMCYRISGTQLTTQEIITNTVVTSKTVYSGICSNAPQNTSFIGTMRGTIYAEVIVPGLSSDPMPSISVYVRKPDSSIWIECSGVYPEIDVENGYYRYFLDGDVCYIGWLSQWYSHGDIGYIEFAREYRVVVVR